MEGSPYPYRPRTAGHPLPEQSDEKHYAKCAVCGGLLKSERLPAYQTDEGTYRIPSYHADCVPDEFKSGQQNIRRDRGKTK